MTHNQIVIIHLMTIILFVIHNSLIEFKNMEQIEFKSKQQTTRLQLGNDKLETQNTQSNTGPAISLETILIARSNIIVLRWTRQWI